MLMTVKLMLKSTQEYVKHIDAKQHESSMPYLRLGAKVLRSGVQVALLAVHILVLLEQQ